MTVTEALILCAVTLLAGAVNAVAGGGTLLSFPTLIYFGVPPVVANATSTMAMFLGTAGSIYSFRGQLREIRWWLWRMLPVSLAGGWLGSVMLTHGSERLFTALVPWLILFATLLFMLQGAFRRLVFSQSHMIVAVIFQLLVAIYGGYFGAGMGILMLAALGLMGMSDLSTMNALKNVLAAAINCVATMWFIASGQIDWPRAAVMTVGAVAGYFIGAHYSQRVPQRLVRTTVIIVGLSVSAVLLSLSLRRS
jgi:uncharacterized membrane protein YfcA